MLVKQIQFTPMEIVNNLYSGYGWDLENGKSCWGKWVNHSVKFKLTGNPGNFRFPCIHIWRTMQLALESKKLVG